MAKHARNKIVASTAAAVEGIENGATVLIGGFGVLQGWPTSLIHALRDRGSRDLTVVAKSHHLDQPPGGEAVVL